ncbi:hypothetical protein QTH90_30775 [Variovorax sp. J2P1-59]|uniref:hypothetical protein n=1 Tax=Variovorax flavidus TaxID=3053501 RepID=UPI002578CFFD|nr:hypothetical protein [Variovorax sp. J2P1-59]MDM0078826.1 hypothetical protein [Variovorax sp. J2P1-59]
MPRVQPHIVGASLLSAAGSLPLHVLPVLVATLSADGVMGPAAVGWVGAAFLCGQLVSSLALPALGLLGLSGRQALIAVVLVLCALGIASLGVAAAILPSWFAIGLACGSFAFLGATASANATDPRAAFSLRLACILWLATITIVSLQLFPSAISYHSLVLVLGITFLAVCGCGLALIRTAPAVPRKAVGTPGRDRSSMQRAASGLAATFLLFVGQPGFWAYTMFIAVQKGLAIGGIVWAIALAKLASGILLFHISSKPPSKKPATALLALGGAGCAAAIAVVFNAPSVVVFFAGIIVWEVSLNVMSARFQAEVVIVAPQVAGPWLTAAIMLGAATGPVVHGAAIQASRGAIFIAYSCLSALVPLIWYLMRKSRTAPPTQAATADG